MMRMVTTQRTGKGWKLLRVLSLPGIALGTLLSAMGVLLGRDAVVLLITGLAILLFSALVRLVAQIGVWWCHE